MTALCHTGLDDGVSITCFDNGQPSDYAVFVRQPSFITMYVSCFGEVERAIPSSVMKWWDEIRS